ncbi:hypothetical protein BS78_05G038400 [Paspalum vaginatum]|nr:hypothetical protein BS78_05G038400 [Paspalum vaginatum]
MGDWSWPRHARRRQPGGGGSRRPPPRPLFPPPDHGQNQCPVPVPLWEREFCSIVGNISWETFCENKEYTGIFHSIKEWDDSGAFENFERAKARFYAAYHGEPSDIPLPDPDTYIDEVDHRCEVDPALVAELDEVRLPFEPEDSPAPAAIARADSKVPRSDFVNPAACFVETPAEDKEWDWGADQMPEPTGWVAAPVDDGGDLGWGAAPEKPAGWSSSHQYHRPSSSRNKNTSGYGGGVFDNRGNRNKNSYGGSDNRGSRNNSFYGGSNNRYQHEGPSPASGRGQSDGGRFQQRQRRNGQRNHQAADEAHQRRSSWSWQDHRGGRKVEWRHVVRPQQELPK